MNLIVHNVTELTDEEGLIRKKQDINFVTSTFQQYLGVSVTINNAFHLGKHSDNPRLLKISVNSEVEKASLLWNANKLKNVDHPEETQHIFITPDLAPKEQQINGTFSKQIIRSLENTAWGLCIF